MKKCPTCQFCEEEWLQTTQNYECICCNPNSNMFGEMIEYEDVCDFYLVADYSGYSPVRDFK